MFVQAFAAPPRMILAGANAFVRALSRTGSQLGYRVTVVDAREVFATPAHFPYADEVVVDWPHRYLRAEAAGGRVDARTVVCVLTHDPKFDVPMLAAALTVAPVAFVGALGSRRTHTDRMARLREQGVTDDQLGRLRSPLGLDLNARTPEETAISIAAQIIAETSGGSGRPLSDIDGPIHR
ncbi:xanthine dehydrogenase [Mycobacteroides abscessus subsp. abscessus]|nr:xanthine dehydrogenase [Mycobacteroides abscessus subsp. abscessus]SKL45350.1 xanthine dehydrogenase [Mycobacteroides abscessus subsp. abscessus]